MGIQKCGECKKKFKWSQIFKSFLFSYRPIICSHCGTEHKITGTSRTLAALSISIYLIIVPFARERELSIFFVILGMLLYFALLTVILPYFMRYRIRNIDSTT